jgi:hypothetical protein
MTPRSLFIIILRVAGILSLKGLLIAVPQLISTVLMLFRGYSGYSIADGLFLIVISLLTVAVYLAISYILIFKAHVLVTKFGLDQHFTEPILNLNISISSILRIAIIVTGFLILVDEIPEFCRLVFFNLQKQRYLSYEENSTNWSPVVFSGVKILIGLLIIGERKRILQFLEKSQEAEKSEQVE